MDESESSVEQHSEFVRLLVRHERRIYAYILSLVPNWNDADEIYQETILRLWSELDRFDRDSNFAAWAVRVAYYQILTWRKKSQRSRLVFGRAALDQIAAAQTSEDLRQSDARHQALGDCIERLSERNRDLLKRSYSEGASLQEVARQLNRSLEAVYKALQRVRLSLHQCIEDRLANEGVK